jgi:hypothetical protein
MQKEFFKDIPNYEGIYQVSNLGNVKSLNFKVSGFEKILKPSIDSSSYYYVGFSKNGKGKKFRIHQLVAMAFLNHIPCGHKIVVDHINTNRLDNRLENLQLISNRENISKDRKNKSSKYVGVSWHKIKNKWESKICADNKSKHLGLFDEEHEAHLAYQNALEMYHKGDLSFLEPKKYSSQYKYVKWNKQKNKWQSIIKKTHIGFFTDEYEAHLAVEKALESLK